MRVHPLRQSARKTTGVPVSVEVIEGESQKRRCEKLEPIGILEEWSFERWTAA